jgi:DNA-binding CsgD family transcriptional regulator
MCPLIGRQLASAREPSAANLSPRARETLACLLEGDGSKQIARRLKISPETVNQYIKAIYRHFGVNSRAELFALWIRRRHRPS